MPLFFFFCFRNDDAIIVVRAKQLLLSLFCGEALLCCCRTPTQRFEMVRFSQAWVFVKLLNGITDVLPSRLSQQHFFFPLQLLSTLFGPLVLCYCVSSCSFAFLPKQLEVAHLLFSLLSGFFFPLNVILLGFFCFSFFFFSFAELHARPRVSLSTFQTRPSLKKQYFEISKKKKRKGRRRLERSSACSSTAFYGCVITAVVIHCLRRFGCSLLGG